MQHLRALASAALLATPIWSAARPDPCAAASSTSDVQFELALNDHGAVFQAGEIIPLTLWFTASVKGRYTAEDRNYDRSGRLNTESYCVTPAAPDPLDWYFKSGGFIGGGLGGIRKLDETPFTASAELNEWRSLPPGHYRVYAVSSRVRRPRNPYEDTSSPMVAETLRSNAIEIEVTAADLAWQAEQLRIATQTLAGKPSESEARHAARVLRFLGTPDATRAMAKLFRGVNQDQPIGFELMLGLYGAPDRQIAIDAMRAQLTAPDHAITSEFLQTLVSLQQASAEPSEAPAGGSELQAYWTARRGRREELMQAAAATVLAGLPRKTGSARALTLNGLLGMEQNNQPLAQNVRSALIAAWTDLPAQTQNELILYRWPAVASPDMLPILREIVAEPPSPLRTQASMTREAALRHIYDLDPAAGRATILSDLRNPDAQPGMDLVKLLSKDELAPELRAAAVRIGQGGERTLDFELIDRYGDSSALAPMRAAFDKHFGRWGCETQSAMLRYFLRVSPQHGVQQVSASLAARKFTGCYRTLLGDLGDRLPAAQQNAIDAIDDSDVYVERNALEALGHWGSPSAEPALWDGLRRFHTEWQGRQDEVRPDMDPKSAGTRAAEIERNLATAIATGTNWICPADRLAQLSELVWSRDVKRQVEGWIRQWNQTPAVIEPTWFPDAAPRFSVLQYDSLTEEQLRAKLAQFPHNLDLRWRYRPANIGAGVEKQDAAYQRVRDAAAQYGIVIGKIGQ